MAAKRGKRYGTAECASYLGVTRERFQELKRKYELKPVSILYKEHFYAASDIAKLSRALKRFKAAMKNLENLKL